MYGYNPMNPSGQMYGQPYGFGQPITARNRMLVGYEQEEPSLGMKLARLGMGGAAKGIGNIAGDATKFAMYDSLKEKSKNSGGESKGSGAEGAAIGGAVGTLAGSVVPGVGNLVGGVTGSVAGGLFDAFFEEEKEPVYKTSRPPLPRLDRYAGMYSPSMRANMYGVQNPYGFGMV